MKKGSSVFRVFSFIEPLFFSFHYLSGRRRFFVVIFGAAVALTITRLLVPIYIGHAVSSIEERDLSGAISSAVFIVYVSAIAGVMRFLVNYLSQYMSQVYAYNLRGDLFRHLLRKKVSFFENETSGDLLSRMTMDVRASRNFILATMAQLIPTMLLIAFSLYFLFNIRPVYALTFFLVVPLLIYTGIIFQKKQRTHWRNIRLEYGRMNEELQENITGQRVVRGFSAEEQEKRKFVNTTKSYYHEYITISRLRGLFINLMPLIVASAATGILMIGGSSLIKTGLSVGPLVSAVNIFIMMGFPISFLGRLIVFSENARAGINRMQTILSGTMEEDFASGKDKIPGNDVEFSDVSFSRDGKLVLRDITLRAYPGETLGITGKTAAGKSTLASLIPRFYDPTSGDVRLGGISVRELKLHTLRSFISLVPQEVNIFSGTIRYNIIFGNNRNSDDRMRRVAEISRISRFIEDLPEGYDTVVGERGITLSGGQKQRIGVARALYTEPHILILDDATSSVDPQTELEMLQAIRRERGDLSIIIISHRDSVLRFCDRVVRIEDGTISALNGEIPGNEKSDTGTKRAGVLGDG